MRQRSVEPPSRNQRGERGRWRMRRVEAANPSLTVGAPRFPNFRDVWREFRDAGTTGRRRRIVDVSPPAVDSQLSKHLWIQQSKFQSTGW